MKDLKLVCDFVRKPQPDHPNRFYVSEHCYIALRRETAEERAQREAFEASYSQARS